MFFANFDTLKIEKQYNFITKNIPLNLHRDTSVKDMMNIIKTALEQEMPEKTTLGVLYHFEIQDISEEFPELNEDFEVEENLQPVLDYLLTVAHIAIPLTLQTLETGKGYKRERRLDVPDKLKPLHASYGALKRACNNEILTPLINIQIEYNNILYLLCDGRNLDVVKGDSSDE